MTWFDEIDKARSKVEPRVMKRFELEGETASGTFRTSRLARSMIEAIRDLEAGHWGWTVLAVHEIDAAMEKVRKVTAAALADNMFKAEMGHD